MKLLKKLFEFKKDIDFINDRRDSKRYDIMLKLNYAYPEKKSSEESFTPRQKVPSVKTGMNGAGSGFAQEDPVIKDATAVKPWSFTKNISRHGLRFQVNSKLPKDSILDIKIEDPNSDKSLLLRGKVAWLEEFSGEEDSEPIRYETGVSILKKNIF